LLLVEVEVVQHKQVHLEVEVVELEVYLLEQVLLYTQELHIP